jgi:hypothetical protein
MEKLQEIERLAFLKYKLSGKKAMNTFIFAQVRLNKLSDKEIKYLLNVLEKRIEKEKKEQASKLNFTCNI